MQVNLDAVISVKLRVRDLMLIEEALIKAKLDAMGEYFKAKHNSSSEIYPPDYVGHLEEVYERASEARDIVNNAYWDSTQREV